MKKLTTYRIVDIGIDALDLLALLVDDGGQLFEDFAKLDQRALNLLHSFHALLYVCVLF
jgi:hypothetical protein